MASTKTAISLPPHLAAEFVTGPRTERRGVSGSIQSALGRYLSILADARSQLDRLTDAEWDLCRDALSGGCWLNEGAEAYVVHEVEDHVRINSAAQQWDVDPDHLLGVLRNLDHAGRVALVDTVERWWAQADDA